MKKLLVTCLVLLIAFSVACSKKEPKKETAQKAKQETSALKKGVRSDAVKVPRMGSLVDPVSGNPVDIDNVPYSYTYNNVLYHFESKENMEAFKKDPEKYLADE